MVQEQVLIVDDDRQVLFVLSEALIRRGYQVTTARSGEEALEEVGQNSFDLVITDLKMDGMSGLELTQNLRQRDHHAPVIWITAFGCNEKREDIAQLGVYRCLDKPLEIGVIRSTVREALEEGVGE